ncbi:MAG TPA: nuclear transport factor 2 family protein [Jatrophihabitans sp.]|nr:nuclear transport factor 2 family protein [Jatrophihabitans sp.]
MSELDDLRAQVRELSDREAIRDVLTTFATAMDAQDWELLASVWTDDATFDRRRQGPLTAEDGTGRVWRGKQEVMAQLVAGVSQHFTSHHVLANHRITLDGDRAKAVTYMQSVHLDDPTKPADHGGKGGWYLTELARTADGWQIARLWHTPVWFAGTMQPTGPVTAEDVQELRTQLRGAGSPVG